MNFSKDNYTLTSPHPIPEIAERLYEQTLIRRTLMRARTDKMFIGEVSEEDFYLMGSSRLGVLCTLDGIFKPEGTNTVIELKTKLHRAFVILFSCWAVFVIGGVIISSLTGAKVSAFSIGQLPLPILAVIGTRLLLHWAYTRARNKSIGEIKGIIA